MDLRNTQKIEELRLEEDKQSSPSAKREEYVQ